MKRYEFNDALPNCPKGVALGLFDGIHLGHQKVIQMAAAAGKGLEPWVFTFSTMREQPPGKQGGGKLLTDRSRDRILEDLGIVSLFCPEFTQIREMDPRQFVDEVLVGRLRAGMVSCGGNFHFGKGAAGNSEHLRALCAEKGIEVRIAPLVEVEGVTVSASRIRQLIEAGLIRQAKAMLGRRFSIDFAVEEGRKLGRTLDYPTINQSFPMDFVRPRFGVYASIVRLDGIRYAGVTNIGVKPTVGSDRLLAETYIRDYYGDLYGQCITVELVEFLRPERKFDSIEALRIQIQEDAERSFRLLEPEIL